MDGMKGGMMGRWLSEYGHNGPSIHASIHDATAIEPASCNSTDQFSLHLTYLAGWLLPLAGHLLHSLGCGQRDVM